MAGLFAAVHNHHYMTENGQVKRLGRFFYCTAIPMDLGLPALTSKDLAYTM